MLKAKDFKFLVMNDLRTVAGFVLTFASLVALLMLTACAPKPVERVYPVAKTDFGPLQKDPSIPNDKLRAAAVDSSLLKWNATVDSARVFRFGETAIELGKMKKSLELQKLGVRIGTAFYNARNTTTHSSFENALFVTAAVGETKEDVMPILDKYDKMLVTQLPLVRSLLKKSAATFPWPKADAEPRVAISLAKTYAKQFLERVQEGGDIDPDLGKGIAGAFTSDFYPLLDALETEVDSILAEPDSIKMIDRIKGLTTKFDVNLGDDTTKLLDTARGIFVDINQIDRNQDALSVIVELWEMTPAESREKTFKPVSESLYNFLKDKGPKSLGCVKSPGCLNPLILIEKKIGVLPAIQKYGLEKLQGDIRTAAHDALVGQIKAAIAGFVPTIPQEIDDKISDQVTKLRAKLASVKADYSGFIHGIAREYVKQDLKSEDDVRINGLEASRVQINLAPGSIALSGSENASISTGSEVIGDSMAYASAVWNSTTPGSAAYSKSVISQIDKMLALGGFETPSKKTYESLAVQTDGTDAHFDVRNDIGSKSAFAVPDSFSIGNEMALKSAKGGKNVSVRGQAELLRGLASMARYFQDWKKNGYDSTIGSVEVGKLIQDLPAGSVDSKLFPKDSFFALSVANAANILVNMTKQLSPVFLVDITRKAQWANERSDDSDQPATMAGIVDIVNSRRTSVVHVADAARFLLAIADFLDATNGMEKTQAHPLITPGQDGKKAIDQLVEARSQLRLLIVGIGNFISHEMQATDGGIRANFQQDKVSVLANEPRRASDQALAILALLKAGEVLDKDIFNWTALDAYAFMNKSLFNSSKGFYVSEEGASTLPAPDEIATILLAGEKLRAKMTNQSQDQWDMISAPWLKALEGLN